MSEIDTRIDPRAPKLYGLYVHNESVYDDKVIALQATSVLMEEQRPLNYEHGDVIVLMPGTRISDEMSVIFESMGMIVQFIPPNRFYKLSDKVIVHYIFTNRNDPMKRSDDYILEWESGQGLTMSEIRTVRVIKTFMI